MKKILPVIIVTIILLLLGAIFVQLKNRNTPPEEEETTTTAKPYPIEYFGGVVPLVPAEVPRVVSDKDNSYVSINDFRQLPKVVSVGEGFYSLNGADPAVDLPYSILFGESDSSFTISLDAIPLDATRERASRDLLMMLDITEEEACKLNVQVGVTYYVDEALSGKDLGLSFCPDKINL